MGDYTNLLLEEIRDQNRAVLEAVGDMQRPVSLIPQMQRNIADMQQDMKVVKAVLKDMNKQLTNHEVRITRLEQA